MNENNFSSNGVPSENNTVNNQTAPSYNANGYTPAASPVYASDNNANRPAGTGESPVSGVRGSAGPDVSANVSAAQGANEYHYTAQQMVQNQAGASGTYNNPYAGQYSNGSAQGSTAYTDAGYVASGDASAVPPRYHYASQADTAGTAARPAKGPKAPKARKEHHGMHPAAIIAVCLVCAILGGIGGGAVMGAVLNRSSASETAEPAAAAAVSESAGTDTGSSEPVVITKAGSSSDSSGSTTNTVTTNIVPSGSVLDASSIYELACQQTVAITTEITYSNVFGYTTSGAVSGSGFIISSNGYILTNHHVIEDAAEGGYEISVLLYDGTEYTATIVGYEEDNDIAVLKIDAEGLNAVTFGDSDSMKVGETIYAVGNPLGELEYTMTTGSVSALDREITTSDSTTGASTTINMFQIDAAVNSGNSGGPVYNNRGEVIGIVTSKYSSTGVEGLGFAIPINDAAYIANELITHGYVSGKAYLGITCQTVSSTVAQYYNMVPGAYVYAIASGSCAEACGLQVGDIIVALDDTEIESSSDLITAKKAYKAGESAVLKVYRSGEYLDLTVTFDEEVPEETAAATESGTDTQSGQSSLVPYSGNPFGSSGSFVYRDGQWYQQQTTPGTNS